MEPRWAQKLDAQREPDRSPLSTPTSTKAHVGFLGMAVFFGMWAGQAAGNLATRLQLHIAASLTVAAIVVALVVWAASFVTRRIGYLALGFGVVFVVAFMGSTVLKLFMAIKS
jgi:hypothetical protein